MNFPSHSQHSERPGTLPELPEGLQILYWMVREQDRGKVVALARTATNREDTDMGLIPESMDQEYEETEVGSGGGGLLPAGDHTGTVVAAEVRESRKPWVDAELSVKLQITEGEHAGKTTFADIELAPLTGKDGQLSKGKLKFVKWQLEALGYEGKLSELEYHVPELYGAVVEFEQKVFTYLDISGNPVPMNGRQPRINEQTGKPYIDREVTLKQNVMPGATAPASASAPTGQTVSY